MKQFVQVLILYTLIFAASFTKVFAQCTPNSILFNGGEIVYNTACGNNSYQVITGQNPTGTGFTYRWEVSFSGAPFSTVVNASNIPISTIDLSKRDITDFILMPNSNASGDYSIRRVVSSASCSNTSAPVYLYYSESEASISGGTVTGIAQTCSPASGTVTVTGNTGPVLRWERALSGTANWEVISSTTKSLSYSNLTTSYCYRALIDNICRGTPAVIDAFDKYSSTFCITVNSVPLVSNPANQTICQGSALNLSVTATSVLTPSYQWRKNGININGATLPSFNIPAVDNLDAGSYDVVVINDCGSVTSAAAVVTINPLPTVTVPGSSILCAGALIPATSFSSNPSGATYTWTNSNTAIGLAASGSGNIPAFTALNTGSTTINSTITVTALLNGCPGPSSSYIITVKPLPAAIVPSSFSVCSGATVSSSNFSSLPVGATFTWTSSNPSVGLDASGSNNVPSFIAVNNTASPVSTTITVIPSINGCTGPASNYTITVNPLPVITSATPQQETTCDASDGKITIVATGAAPLEYSINGGSTFQSANLFENLAAGSYTVAVRNANGCIVVGQTVTVTSPGAPAAPIVNSYQYPVCEGSNLVLSVQNPDNSLVYTWTGPGQFNGTGQTVTIPNVSPSMAGSYAVTATSGACVGLPTVFNVAVSPLPVVTVPPNLTFCSGATIPEGVFISTPAGATYSWTNSNPEIGLVVSGTSNVPTFTAINTTTLPITATITVTPSLNNCTGQSKTFTITVNPLPAVVVPASFAVCAGAPVSTPGFSSNISGTTYTWTNSNSAIGLPSNGSGNLPVFTAINNSDSPISSIITVTPISNGCAGTPLNFTITVNPLPEVTVPVSSSVCAGTSIPASSFSSIPPNASYTWTNSNTDIGLGPNGTGNVPAFTATNSSFTTITSTITVTPFLNGCAGPSSSYTITVKPLPLVTVPASFTICSGAVIPATNFTSSPAGATYNWTISSAMSGLSGSGSGNIPAYTAVNNTTSPITATVTVTPTLNGCTGPSSSYTITVNPLPLVSGPANTTVCAGSTVPPTNFSSSLSGTTYNWTNSNTAIGLAASGSGNIPGFIAINSGLTGISSTITVTPTSNGCEGPPVSYTITVNPLPVISSATVTNESQCNINDGTITITATGTQPLEYSINGGSTFVQNGGNFTGLAAGSYLVVVRNVNGCIIMGPTLSVSSPGAPPQPAINAYVSPVCQGEPLILSILNPDPQATYNWTGPLGFTATGPNIIRSNSDPSMSGNYAVTATVSACVSVSKIFNIVVSPLPTLTVPQNQTFCSGSNVPEIIFNSTPPGATLNWTNSNPLIGLAASGNGNIPTFTAVNNTTSPITATITITPTLNNCTGQAYTYTITVYPLPIVSVPASSTVCAGTMVSSTNFISSLNGASFTWTNSNTAIGLGAGGSGNIPGFTAANLSGGPITATITVTPSLNGCVGPSSAYTITVNPLPIITSAIAKDESQCNIGDGTITISASGIQPLEYSINGGITFVQNGGNFTGLAAGSYSVVVRNASGCIFTGPTLSVASPGAPPQPAINDYENPICQGEPLIFSVLNPDPNASYKWIGPMGYTATGPSVTRLNADPSMSGSYAVTATLNSCVSVSKIFSITVNPLPTLVVPANLSYCTGAMVPESIFNSNPPGASISWTNSNPEIGLAASGTGNIPAFTAINNTLVPIIATISVTPRLNNCSGQTYTYTITINPTPTVVVPADLSVCADGQVQPSNFSSNITGTTYTWTNSNTTIGLPASGSGNLPGFTSVNLTTAVKTAIITVTPTLNGCPGPSSTYTITIKPLPRLSNASLTQALCTGSSSKEVVLTSTIPGTTFTWTAAGSSFLEGYTASGTSTIPVQLLKNNGTSAGTISYTITPFYNGCAGPASVYTIIVNPLPTATLSGGKTACFGANTTLTVNLTGTAPWTITYTDGSNPVTISGIGTNIYTFNVTASSTKTYTITSVSDGLSCSNTGSGSAVVIQPPAAVDASASFTNVSCYSARDGSITVETSAGGFGTYEYSINGGLNWQASRKFTGLAPGTYQLFVRDAAHPECISAIQPGYTILQPAAPLSLTFTRTDVSCFGGSNGALKLTASGGTAPYSYSWSGGQTTKDLSGITAGTYTVTIKDSKGCEYKQAIIISQPSAALKIAFVKTDVSCFGGKDGSIDISVSGGTLPYSYTWSNQERSEDIRNLAPNTSYTLTVIDANGCSINQAVTINEPAPLRASLTVKNTTCKLTVDGAISASITGGTAPYTINWVGLPQNGTSISSLRPGTYQLIVTDSKGCTFTVSQEVAAGNCPPIAIDDRYRTDEEVAVSGTVALNDFDQQEESLSFSIITPPKNGTITFNSDGSFTYKPNVGFYETETITYRVCNTSGLCATAKLYIDVIPYTVVSLTPSVSSVREGKKVSITARLMRPFKDDVTVRISYTGKAGKDRDYVLLDQYIDIRIPRGKIGTLEKVTLAALTDDLQEGDEDVILTITATSNPLVRIGTGAIVIINDVYPPDSLTIPVNTELPPNPDIRPDPLISPNGDGQGNDFFVIENLVSFPDNQVLIFNRWGNEVFRVKGYNESDRVFKGYANTGLLSNSNAPLADGVYYYLITTNRTINGQLITGMNKGYLILKR